MDRPMLSATDPQATTVAVEILRTGTVSIDRALAYEESTRHPMPETGWFRPAEAREWVPVSAYLLHHPDGPILVDTGWHTDVRTNKRRHLGRLNASLYDADLPPGEAITEQLAERGLAPADLAAVVITHLHSDHVSGLRLVEDAPRILVSEPELESVTGLVSLNRLMSGHMWGGIEFESFGFEETGIGPYERSHDLCGDGSIQLVWVPGHADGQVAVLARTADGLVLLASDAVYSTRNIEDGVPPGAVTERDAAVRSVEWVGEMQADPDCVAVIANHDPAVDPRRIDG